MEEYVEVMRRTLGLAETCMEGLHYISRRLGEGIMEETMYLFEDVVHGFYHIANSIQVLESVIPDHELLERTTQVEMAIQQMISTYEMEDINLVAYSMSHVFLPSFQAWSDELIYIFHPHILS